ncbi:BrnT family toxin [Nostoc sp. FACHB-87]|uniref:BrnT family toxin n=1 Tax=Nostoc spongiaeforme FACHB-130 TaxID=1357510 RepID=A0ABR8G5J1_9NOSO|nr:MULTISPECIES: BrnT family toxin [Nostocales]MBD2297065.1 BrnT family toxin [Nostoc sp. FACHB-190]MBD2454951.1 BrnT family toxin [Nostoc sp. FACHB-87]MBD2474728.1 BrnT family toxin [Anabaena sp. FACHB-83]MBD2488073.1 BrnT family toxin [Aulosira sp. FACHB-615]MBD2598526.1 BrnT family toxin [Nostoc spongiaeforme FACHB-130]
MEFEFDDSKSQSNLAKHGINFLEAQELWADPDRVEIPARIEDEPRFLVIGKIAQKCWSAIITYRENRVRIISVRRSRQEEVAIYESNRI